MGQARRRMLTRFQPLVDGLLGIAGGGQMMSQEFGLNLNEVGTIPLQNCRNTGVQLLSSRTQQRAVGRRPAPARA